MRDSKIPQISRIKHRLPTKAVQNPVQFTAKQTQRGVLTKNQTKLLDGIVGFEDADTPHLKELAASMVRAFGGTDELAQMLRGLVDNPKAPDWLRMRAAGIVCNAVAGASKLAENESDDGRQLTHAELMAAAQSLFYELFGITPEMESELKAVVAAWPELPAGTRTAIVGLVTSAHAQE